MGTKANPGKFDCYANAEPDEPIFVLLGRDPNAPTLVWLWAALRELRGENPEKVQEARDCVVKMIAFAVKKGKPVGGIGESVLAGIMDLIRVANNAVDKPMTTDNEKTDDEIIRMFLAKTAFEPSEK